VADVLRVPAELPFPDDDVSYVVAALPKRVDEARLEGCEARISDHYGPLTQPPDLNRLTDIWKG
jgi:hypothetical protein